jgi:hypothetical protein
MPGKKKVKPGKSAAKSTAAKSLNSGMQKQIDEIRNSVIALFNIMFKKGITNEKEFMDEYKKVSSSKKK